MSVHSHAAAQKSSGAFFRGLGRERCRKRPACVRIALRASQAVQTRDVMFNPNCSADMKKPPGGGFFNNQDVSTQSTGVLSSDRGILGFLLALFSLAQCDELARSCLRND